MFPWGSCNLGEFSLGQLGWGYHLIPFSKKLQLLGESSLKKLFKSFFLFFGFVYGGKEKFGKIIKPSTFGLKRGF